MTDFTTISAGILRTCLKYAATMSRSPRVTAVSSKPCASLGSKVMQSYGHANINSPNNSTTGKELQNSLFREEGGLGQASLQHLRRLSDERSMLWLCLNRAGHVRRKAQARLVTPDNIDCEDGAKRLKPLVELRKGRNLAQI